MRVRLLVPRFEFSQFLHYIGSLFLDVLRRYETGEHRLSYRRKAGYDLRTGFAVTRPSQSAAKNDRCAGDGDLLTFGVRHHIGDRMHQIQSSEGE